MVVVQPAVLLVGVYLDSVFTESGFLGEVDHFRVQGRNHRV